MKRSKEKQTHQNINPGVGRSDRGANLGNNQSCLQLHPWTTFPGANPHPCHHHLHHLKVDKVQQDLLSGSGPIQFCQSPPAGLWPAGEENQSRFFLRIFREIVFWEFFVRLFDEIFWWDCLIRFFWWDCLMRFFWWDCLMRLFGEIVWWVEQGVGSVLELPGLDSKLREVLREAIASFMVRQITLSPIFKE